MFPPPRKTLLFLLSATVALAASTRVSSDRPIVNFRLPDFTPEGYRSWLVRGTEARYANEGLVDIKELNLTIFTGKADGKLETMILSPSAQLQVADRLVSGKESIRIINDRLEATGSDWRYDHANKKVSIAKNVRVVLHTQLQDILK
jgi:hypothetical protein